MGEIAMGINDADPTTSVYVLEDEVAKERGFAGTCLSQAVHMLAPVGTSKTEGFAPSPEFTPADEADRCIRIVVMQIRIVFLFAAHVPGLAATPTEVKVF